MSKNSSLFPFSPGRVILLILLFYTPGIQDDISNFSELFHITVKVYNDFPHHLFSSICWFCIWNMPKESVVDIGISWNEEHWCLSFLTSNYDKIQWQKQSNFGEKGAVNLHPRYSPSLQGRHSGKGRERLQADIHITSIIRNRKHRVPAWVLSALISIRLRPAHEIVMPTFWVRR